jgi:uncharacterized protein (TIGR01244 family)
MSTSAINNYVRINDRVITAGQPTEAQLREAAAEGFEVIINLAPPGGGQGAPADEAACVRALGLAYHHIPIAWEAPNAADLEAFIQAMRTAAGRRVFIHCTASYRSLAFFSLYAIHALGWSPAEAEELRSHIWEPGEYPVWDAFIEAQAARLAPEAANV